MTENAQFSGMTWARRAIHAMALLAVVVFGALPMLAQFDTGTITGTVTDARGHCRACHDHGDERRHRHSKEFRRRSEWLFCGFLIAVRKVCGRDARSGFTESKTQPVVSTLARRCK